MSFSYFKFYILSRAMNVPNTDFKIINFFLLLKIFFDIKLLDDFE